MAKGPGLVKLAAVTLLSWSVVAGIAIDLPGMPQEAADCVVIRGEVKDVQYSSCGGAYEIEVHDGHRYWWLVVEEIDRLPSANDEVLALCLPLDGGRLRVVSMVIT